MLAQASQPYLECLLCSAFWAEPGRQLRLQVAEALGKAWCLVAQAHEHKAMEGLEAERGHLDPILVKVATRVGARGPLQFAIEIVSPCVVRAHEGNA